ncbi:hypothetical protein MBLNU459_g5584t1 [Dothideomycetes sp. NU459]
MAQHTTTPDSLPVPVDDGACAHLTGHAVPSLPLPATSLSSVDVSRLSGLTIVFCYPRTGAPGETVPDEWNAIPGARGCTPQACSFRDNAAELRKGGVGQVFGMSTQDTPYQTEAKERLHLPYELLSDEKLDFVRALKLPTFEWEGKKVIKRLTLAIVDGKIVHVWYPVFPSRESAGQVLKWLENDYNR